MYNSYTCDGEQELCKLLKNIVKLQREAVRAEIQDEFCDFNKLGGCGLGGSRYNTRPLEIYTDEDTAWTCPIVRENVACQLNAVERTCIFRIEKVENGLATFRALIEVPGENRFIQTDSFKSIRICNISAIRCLRDTFVDLCIR